jgi:hypothetical protein
MITPPYRILEYRGREGLLCLACNTFSWHPNDVRYLFCAKCELFLERLPEMLRCNNVRGNSPGLLLGRGDPTLPLPAEEIIIKPSEESGI